MPRRLAKGMIKPQLEIPPYGSCEGLAFRCDADTGREKLRSTVVTECQGYSEQ
jgi:hypothetical protein